MKQQVRAGTRAVRGRPVLLFVLAATLFVALGSEGIDRLGQAHFLTDLRFPPVVAPVLWLGGFSALAAVGSVALTEIVRRRTDVLHPAKVGRVLVASQATIVLAVGVFALAGGFWLAAAGWLVLSLLRSACAPLFDTWIVAHTESATRATVFSAAGMVDAAGQIVGGPPVGFVGQRLSIRAALLTSALFMTPAAALLGVALARERREDLPGADAATVRDRPLPDPVAGSEVTKIGFDHPA